MSVSTDDISVLQLGTFQDAGQAIAFRTTEEVLKAHMAIFGGTRYGKSKLFELICRQLIVNGRGFAFIDPHSDTADDLLAFLACNSSEFRFICNRVHYLKPGDRLFSFDPFRYRPDPNNPEANTEFRYRTWLHTKIKDMVKIICRQQGDTEEEAQKQVRLRRWLYNALYAVGVRQDAAGTHLPLGDAFVLLNPRHERHQELYSRVEPFLDGTVRSDFEKLRRTQDARKQEDWVESTFNRLRDILSPIVQRIFNLEAPSIDFHEIIQRRGIILASLGKTNYFHEDEAHAIAGLLIREISEAVRTVDRGKRKPFYLFMDEAQNFLGEDLLRLLKESAKYKLSVGLAVQALDNLQKGEIDLAPAVLGQCGIRITFRQQYHKHAEVLAQCLCYPLLDFTELLHEVDRDDGYDFVLMPSESVGESVTHSIAYSRSQSHQRGVAHQHGVTHSQQESASLAASQSKTKSRSSQWKKSVGVSDTVGEDVGASKQITDAQSKDHTKSSGTSQSDTDSQQSSSSDGYTDTSGLSFDPSYAQSRNQSAARTQQDGTSSGSSISSGTQQSSSDREGSSHSEAKGQSISHKQSHSDSVQSGVGGSTGQAASVGETITKGQTRGQSISNSTTHSETFGASESTTEGEARATNHSLTLALTPLHKTRTEQQKTGQLERSIADQTAMHTHALQSLAKQHCLVAVAAFNSAFILRVHDVADPFEQMCVSNERRRRTIQRLKESIFERHPHFFRADSNAPKLSERTAADNIQPPSTADENPFGT